MAECYSFATLGRSFRSRHTPASVSSVTVRRVFFERIKTMPWKNPHSWLVISVAVAFLGGVIGYFRHLKATQGVFSFISFFFHSFTAAFVGTVAAIAAKEFGYSYEFAGAMGGVAGMFSKPLVDSAWHIATTYLEKKFGLNLEGVKSKGGKNAQ